MTLLFSRKQTQFIYFLSLKDIFLEKRQNYYCQVLSIRQYN